MIDWTQRHLSKIEKENREVLLAGATIEQFKNGKWPAGSSWFHQIGVVGPENSAPREEPRRDLA